MNIRTIRDTLKQVLNQRLKITDDWRSIPDDFHVKDSGLDLDSIESLELLVGIEQAFDIRLDLAGIDRNGLSSLPYLVDIIAKQLDRTTSAFSEDSV